MLPQTLDIRNSTAHPIPTKTYQIDWDNKHIKGFIDGVDAIEQAVDLHLTTERYQWTIYSWQYGSDIYKLIGEPYDYVKSEMKRMIKDALSIDSRITDVDDFEFSFDKGNITCKFRITTNEGEFDREVDLNA